MKSFSFSEQTFVLTIRFLAHLFSVLLIVVVILLTLGETFPGSSDATSREFLLTISLIIMLVGLFTAWKWEGIGGSLIILGFLLFLILNSVFSDFLQLGFFFLLFPLTGILFLLCCLREKNKNEVESKFHKLG